MAKVPKYSVQKSIERKIKKGCGQGRGVDYVPWLKAKDVPSQGISAVVYSHKVCRQLEFLSTAESDYYYLCEWSQEITDIREQYPVFCK